MSPHIFKYEDKPRHISNKHLTELKTSIFNLFWMFRSGPFFLSFDVHFECCFVQSSILSLITSSSRDRQWIFGDSTRAQQNARNFRSMLCLRLHILTSLTFSLILSFALALFPLDQAWEIVRESLTIRHGSLVCRSPDDLRKGSFSRWSLTSIFISPPLETNTQHRWEWKRAAMTSTTDN